MKTLTYYTIKQFNYNKGTKKVVIAQGEKELIKFIKNSPKNRHNIICVTDGNNTVSLKGYSK